MPKAPLDLDIVFIVGVARTGTTWVLSLMTQHPDCFHVTAESLGMNSPVAPTLETALFVKERPWRDTKKVVSMLSLLPDDKLLVEKTPIHGTLTKRIRGFIKHPKFILCIRDPLDTLRSMMQPNPAWKTSPQNLQEAVRRWLSRYRTAEEIQADHVVRYEDLWNDPHAETTKLYERFNLTTDHVSEAVSKTIYGRSLPEGPLRHVYGGGMPGRGKDFFSQADIDYINRRINDARG